MALSTDDGNALWTSYSIPLPPKGTGKLNNMGIEIEDSKSSSTWRKI